MLTACFLHKTHQTAQTRPWAPTIGENAPSKPEATSPDLPLQALTIPDETTDDTSAPQMPPEQPAKRKVRHKKPANKNVEEASNGTAAVSAIGQLSPGDPTDQQRKTNNLIVSTEHDLNSITRKLNDQEQKTAAQAREFLKQARVALSSGDVDGADTLALKAQVLLSEISK
jgi:hypothetical protein